jgi:outer membrane autotransporter protein
VVTNDPDRHCFNLGAGVTANFKRGVSGFFYYETVLGRGHVTAAHSFTAGLRYQFE